ncbi:hypothetical protein POSPLADRAFT_1143119 [Postia placenta MAD-698-R-SB12]|uniref:F-box domain-containing protein n=1 Tax=Postia placenta MAD-698-R-SB12 TaxID=670580 RepID=A0A1X6N002_9APHY|nr:hypothetical protein POSPLADRAFT_1143119 [Postia placenta MAD-698-R-SB12]OSX61935.1 hypothetical protein POSPLADRAFT_1143119 [Postia placenta MAD-698-R-SB12]
MNKKVIPLIVLLKMESIGRRARLSMAVAKMGVHQGSTLEQPQFKSTLLDFNDDVHTMIVSHITPEDALKLSLVARRVHLVAQRQALSYVIMSSMQSVSRICTYMLADISGRLKWVRGLCMYAALPYKGSNPDANYPQMVDKAAAAMRLFVSLYQHTTTLRYLYFAVIEKLLSFQPLLLDVLSSLINIVEIQVVRCGGSETPKLLNGMRSRPRHLVLNIDPVRPLPLETGASMSSIARLRDLRTMEIVGLKDQNANRPALLMRNLRHSLPNVIDLTLSACQMDIPAVLPLKSLCDTFWRCLRMEATNLRCLEIDLCLYRETKDLGAQFLRWMTTVPSTLSPIMSLSYLAVCIDAHMSSRRRCIMGAPMTPIDLDESEDFKQFGVDVEDRQHRWSMCATSHSAAPRAAGHRLPDIARLRFLAGNRRSVIVTSWYGYAHLPVLPPSIVAACQGQVHAFDSQDLVDVYIPDGPDTLILTCEQQPCPNRTPRLIEQDYPRYKAIRRAQHPSGPRSTLASRSALRHSRPVSPSSRLPQTVAGPSQAQGDLPPDPAPEPEPEESASEEGVSESESADPARPTSPTALASTSAVPDSQQLPSSAGSPSSPASPIMSSPAAAPDKETLKLLLPLRYDGKTVVKCNRFVSQLLIYWAVNTTLSVAT